MTDFVETFHDMIITVYCNLTKLEHFLSDSKMECLQLTMTEVLKRQNSKSKKGYNQVSETWLLSVWFVVVEHSSSTFSTLQNILKIYKNKCSKIKSVCRTTWNNTVKIFTHFFTRMLKNIHISDLNMAWRFSFALFLHFPAAEHYRG